MYFCLKSFSFWSSQENESQIQIFVVLWKWYGVLVYASNCMAPKFIYILCMYIILALSTMLIYLRIYKELLVTSYWPNWIGSLSISDQHRDENRQLIVFELWPAIRFSSHVLLANKMCLSPGYPHVHRSPLLLMLSSSSSFAICCDSWAEQAPTCSTDNIIWCRDIQHNVECDKDVHKSNWPKNACAKIVDDGNVQKRRMFGLCECVYAIKKTGKCVVKTMQLHETFILFTPLSR